MSQRCDEMQGLILLMRSLTPNLARLVTNSEADKISALSTQAEHLVLSRQGVTIAMFGGLVGSQHSQPLSFLLWPNLSVKTWLHPVWQRPGQKCCVRRRVSPSQWKFSYFKLKTRDRQLLPVAGPCDLHSITLSGVTLSLGKRDPFRA